ncbi:MAG: flagellar protein FlaG [Bacilli bacterium]|jgi:flagellar protein FlaG
MERNVAAVMATANMIAQDKPSAQRPEPEKRAESRSEIEQAVDLRLVIDIDEASGSYVYKTVNRLTGEVVAQVPREDLLRMRDRANYQAGQLIKARA